VLQPRLVNLNAIVNEWADMLRPAWWASRSPFQLHLDRRWDVIADPDSSIEVIANLAARARCHARRRHAHADHRNVSGLGLANGDVEASARRPAGPR